MSPTECDNGEKGKAVYLIVVPTVHRQEVLGLAYDLSISGYFGIRKCIIEFYSITIGLVSKKT